METEPEPPPDLPVLIRRAQSRFARAIDPQRVFDSLLPDLLAASGSEAGFIGEVRRSPTGAPALKLFSQGDRAGIQPPHGAGAEVELAGTLCGAALRGDGAVIANDAPNDPRGAAGLPGPWPGLSSPRRFCAVPLHYGGDAVGLIGLANRASDYEPELLAALDPLFQAVAGIIGAVQLDRDRSRAEAALRESERRYRSTFELAGVGIAHLALDGRFIEVNDRFCQIVGHPQQALVGKGYRQITHPDDLDPKHPHLTALRNGHEATYQAQKRYLRADGGVVWAQLNVALARDPQGEPDHLVAVINDITERKQAQEARIAAEAAARTNLAKTEFLSRVSHELRTPLNAVQGFAQLLRLDLTQPLSPSQLLKVQHIEHAGSRLLAMINDVLDLSRIESGSLKVQIEMIALDGLVAEVVAAHETAARDAQVLLKLQPAAAPGVRVLADRARLQQVLANLLSNALKFNQPGGEVCVRWQAPADGSVTVQVADTGVGMTAQQQAHLFEPFNRLGAERSRVQGTGIGLVVTRRLVDLMGGTLQVSSEPGRGSTFSLSLPAAPEAASAAATLVPPLPQRILYAEDNPSNVELLRQVLSLRPQWQLKVARNGAEAIAAIGAERFDLLLLDMHLGDMTGLQLVAAIQDLPHTLGVPRVALSADAMPDRVQEARRAGIDVYLTKPLDVAALLRCLDDYLDA